MRIYTSHAKPGAPPVLLAEGFSWGAAVFGWVWLLLRRAWVPAILVFAAWALAWRLGRALGNGAPMLGLFLLQGFCGRDLLRWGLERRGFMPGPVVAAADEDAAFGRLAEAGWSGATV